MPDNIMLFVFNSILLGVGLAMDAFSVSIANALCEPRMTRGKACLIAGTYGAFQFAMPMIGWICVHTVIGFFAPFADIVPWIALVLLSVIGGKMIYESFRKGPEEERSGGIGAVTLLMQGIATSIDALSVGFTIADYSTVTALAASLIIAAVTFAICVTGIKIGRMIGSRFVGRAQVIGGIILIFIGIEIAVLHFR